MSSVCLARAASRSGYSKGQPDYRGCRRRNNADRHDPLSLLLSDCSLQFFNHSFEVCRRSFQVVDFLLKLRVPIWSEQSRKANGGLSHHDAPSRREAPEEVRGADLVTAYEIIVYKLLKDFFDGLRNYLGTSFSRGLRVSFGEWRGHTDPLELGTKFLKLFKLEEVFLRVVKIIIGGCRERKSV